MKYEYENRRNMWTWQKEIKKTMEEYARNPMAEDKEHGPLTGKKLFGSFAGEPVTRDKR